MIGIQCPTCKHIFPDGSGCKAFPLGIPAAILTGRVDHTKPVPGDRSVRYEPAKSAVLPDGSEEHA